MAITSVGSLCSGSDKNTGSSDFTLTPSRTVPVGAVLLAFIGWDSVFSIFQPNDGEITAWISDTQDNIWCTIGACVDTTAFFNGGAQATLMVCQVQRQLTTGDTLTIHGPSAFTGTIIAKTCSIEEFDFGGDRFAIQGPWGKNKDRFTQPADFGFSHATNQEWLLPVVHASDGPGTDSFTIDSDYTAIVQEGTTGGADDTNITVCGGFRIATLSSDTYSSTNNTADRVWSQCGNMICAVPAYAFPTTGLIDDFNRADESPVLGTGPLWDTTPSYGSSYGHLVGNQVQGGGGSRLVDVWTGCAEVYAELTGFSGSDTFSALHHFLNDDSSAANMRGGCSAAMYHAPFGNSFDNLIFAYGSGQQGDPVGQQVIAFIFMATGQWWGMQRRKGRGDQVGLIIDHLWVDFGSGWEEVAAIYHGETFFVPGTGSPGFGNDTSANKMDNFSGGMTPCFDVMQDLPQIIRRPTTR